MDEAKAKKSERVINIEFVHQDLVPNLDKSSIYFGVARNNAKDQLNLNDI